MKDNYEILPMKIRKLQEEIVTLLVTVNTLPRDSEEYRKMLNIIKRKKEQIKSTKTQEISTREVSASNGVISLIARSFTSYHYDICISGTNEKVGYIEYRGLHCGFFLGDIDYRIEYPYRGNGYAYQALELLGAILKEAGIEEVWISANPKNVKSLKIIEKFGGSVINETEGAICYSCPTRESKNTKAIIA